MTKRLYYNDTFLHEFDANIARVIEGDRPGVVLDQTAFYPTSGGQVFDRGTMVSNGSEATVEQVEETESGEIVHYINPADVSKLRAGEKIRGIVDAERRRDHMQQHSGQHVLSAAFERLYNMPTVSFHMGDESCTIDLATNGLKAEQIIAAEKLANDVVFENRPVQIRFVPFDEAKSLGLRKLPDVGKEELRLIDIADFDLCACGGTHVQGTAQIGMVLVRKFEKVKQGFRVEFVCGLRALHTARRDFETLTQAAGLYSAHIYEVPKQIAKSLDEIKSAQKAQHKLVEELAEFWAGDLAANSPGAEKFTLVKQVFADRDLAFVKMLAQKLSRQPGVLAILGTTMGQPSIVLSRSEDVDVDVSALMKEAMASVGGRGGGTKDLAQGGVPDGKVSELVDGIASRLS
ncbi:MAG TPA: alanine--tRNA ligase-related protein [Terriglobales bacterium]|nr:alanine--tRNA ligase-related protein [Terriglobales bacterium]